RKSTEDKDRQVISIESQERELLEFAKKGNLDVVGIYHEEKSAHKRGRPVFAKTIDLMDQGKANAYIVWQPNRIARNTADGGLVISYMDEGTIREVKTPFKTYTNSSDDKFFLLLEFGMAKKSSDDMIVSVKRGHRAKVLAGWRNGVAPLGYLNNLDKPKGERNIIIDPERFDLVKRIFQLFLTGEYSVRKIRQETIKWKLKTRQTKRQGGNYLQISHIYRILTQPFYYGWFNVKSDSDLHKGEHLPMITVEEFDLIQARLGRKGRQRPRSSLNFPYTGQIECGECSSMITAEEKHQLICTECKFKFSYKKRDNCPRCGQKIEEMKKPSILHYVYYHCTKRKNDKCTQHSIRIEDLEPLIDQKLSDFKLSPEFTQWALEELAEDNERTINSQNAVIDSQQKRYKDVVSELQNLTKLYTSPSNANGELLSMEEYEPQRRVLLQEKKQIEEAQQDVGKKIEEWIDWTENSFNFAVAARVWFENGSPEQKRTIFASLSGSNLILKDNKLSVSLKKPLDLYKQIAIKYPSTTQAFEPTKYRSSKRKYLPFETDIPALRMG
ncbi:MAG: recombinase family protein, partial [Nitrospira sp.]